MLVIGVLLRVLKVKYTSDFQTTVAVPRLQTSKQSILFQPFTECFVVANYENSYQHLKFVIVDGVA